MPKSKRHREGSDDDDQYGQACEVLPDMSNRPPSSRPECSEPPCQRRRTTPLYTDESVSVSPIKDSRRAGGRPTHRPQRHHGRDRGRPLDPRVYSNDLFMSRQLGSLALSSLLELANLGSAYEDLKHFVQVADAHEAHRRMSAWVEHLLNVNHFPLKNKFSPMSEVLVHFVRVACRANQKRAVVEALIRLVKEDGRAGSTELVS